MDKRIQLSVNHTRSLSSCLIVVEKSLVELYDLMHHENNYCCNEVLKDIDDNAIAENIKIICEARKHICELSEKYGTSSERLSLQQIINAKRAKIWEILNDTLSKKTKGFGTFPKKHSEEYDSDIRKLIEITNRINY
jgi:hypothetical protein